MSLQKFFPELDFPTFEMFVEKRSDKWYIYDVIRKKYVVLTLEEWVRQHLIHYLINHLNYPASLIQVEYGFFIKNKAYRVDLATFSRQAKPLLLCECKAPTVKLTAKTISQAAMYNYSQQAPYMFITNGLSHYCFFYNGSEWIKQNKVPDFKDIL